MLFFVISCFIHSIFALEACSEFPNASLTVPVTTEMAIQGKTAELRKASPGAVISCPAETIVSLDYGNFEFPSTPARATGSLVAIPCPFGPLNSGAEDIKRGKEVQRISGGGKRSCFLFEGQGVWQSFEHNNCRPAIMPDTIRRVKEFLNTNPTFNAFNIRQLLPLLNKVFMNAVRDYESAEVLVEAVNRVLEDEDLYADASDNFMNLVRENMFTFLNDYTKFVNLSQGQRVQVKRKDILLETAVFPDDDLNYTYSIESFNLPNEAIRMGKNGRLKVKAFSDNLFFHWGRDKDWIGENETEVSNGTELEFTSGWRIYTVEFNEAEVVNLSTPVSYSYTLNESSDYRWVCAFWDTTALAWSTVGMRTLKVHNTIRCESSHLTAFSALIDPMPRNDAPNASDTVLSIISIVLSSISVTGLALTALTYTLFRKLRRERSNQILLNLALALLFLHTMSLSAAKTLWNSLCIVPTLLLHYCLLSSFAWMFCYGMHLYRILVCVFVQPETRFILKRCALAWGVPLLIVIATALIDSEMYSEGRGDQCVFAGNSNLALYYSLYLAPLVIIMVANTFVFVRIIVILVHQSSRQKKQMRSVSDPRDRLPNFLSPIQVRGTITLFVLLGTGWIVGLLAIGPFETVFRYAYVVINAGQGMMIFVFRVLLDPNAMTVWRRTVLSSDSELSYTTSSNNRKARGITTAPYTISPTFISSATNSNENSVTATSPLAAKLAESLYSIIHASAPPPEPYTGFVNREN